MASQSTIAETDLLFELVETKLRLVEEMYSLTISQGDFVAAHDMTGLMKLLSRKQSLMETLHEVQSQLARFADQDPESRTWSSTARRQRCQSNNAVCGQRISEMLVMEGRSIDNMAVQRELVSQQLHQITDASRIQQAYSSSDWPEDDSGNLLSFTG
jgi:hypothetical protein